jgi:hypothetical protein
VLDRPGHLQQTLTHELAPLRERMRLVEAEEKVATESEIREAVRGGTLPLEAHERYGTF